MTQRQFKAVVSCVSAVALGGCATVDPSGDYDRVAGHVQEATGFTSIYRPGDEAIVAAKIAELLSDRLTTDDAVQICLINNPKLQSEFLNVGMARANVVQSGLLSNPSLGLSLRLPARLATALGR